MAPLQIAIITPTYPPQAGGIATAHCQMARALRSRFEVNVFAYDDARPDEPGVVRRQTPAWVKRVLERAIRRYLNRKDPRGRFTICPSILGISVGSRRLHGPLQRFAPQIVIVPDAFLPLYWLRPPAGAKIVWVSHNNFLRFRDNPLIGPGSHVDNDVARSMERRALSRAHAVVCPSQFMVGEYERAYDRPLPVYMIHNFIDHEGIAAIAAHPVREELGIGLETPLVYIPSAGLEQKGKRYTFEILRRVHAALDGKVAFFLSGGIPADLKREIELHGRLTVHAPGHVEWSTNVARAKACDLAVSPTLVENFSLAIIEGLVSGLPCVTFDTGGNCEMVFTGENGAVIPYADVEALVAESVALLRAPDTLRQQGRRAAERIREQLDTDVLVDGYARMFDEVLGESAGLGL